MTIQQLRCFLEMTEDAALLGRRIYLQWQKGSYLSPAVRRFRTFVLSEFGEKESEGGSSDG